MHGLSQYVIQRATSLGLSTSELARRTGLSRQTLHDLALIPEKLPTLATVSALAQVLEVHPMRLLQFVFPLPVRAGLPPKISNDDVSAFVSDVTIPDGQAMWPGQPFVKTWTIRNAGSVPWQDRWLVSMDEHVSIYSRRGDEIHVATPLRPQSSRVPIPTTLPGEVAEISVSFTAPLMPGTVMSYWKSSFADGTLCFPDSTGLWVKVQVVTERSTRDGMPPNGAPSTEF